MQEKEYRYMVVTRCMTYNQVPYIEDTLRGFVIQETTFPVVYIIIDDASTDGEPEILRKWAEINLDFEDNVSVWRELSYGQLAVGKLKNRTLSTFVFLLLKDNHYKTKTGWKKLEYISEWNSSAKYSAICEGDDYWTDAQKLQKQVRLMESDETIGLVHARAKIYNQEKKEFIGQFGDNENGFEQIILRNPIVTLTTCFRNTYYVEYLREREKWDYKAWKMGDYPLWIWIAYHSKVCFMDEDVAVYRELNNSRSHFSTLNEKLAFIESTKVIQSFFAELFHQEENVKKKIQYNSDVKSARACYDYGDRKAAKSYMKQLSFKDRCKIILRH